MYNKPNAPVELSEVFGRINNSGTVDILFIDDGERVNQLNSDVYPVGECLNARNYHSRGVVLSLGDAQKLGIIIE
ncbi:hypothetical protein [Pantoea sp. BAV 3049]|uniref:hypothetical protein n=1 Tax=Pantoea sp. BAV 3049 TaxID=2654188 RepID=UPI00131B6C46|nr:hypothetical protein [Pantoea sp. BAV 3049]